jgi:hypothetical protein
VFFLSLREVRFSSIIVGMLLSFGVLVGVNWLYQQYLVKAPLGEALSQRTEIIAWSLKEDSNKTVLMLELGPVSNLKESCRAILDITTQYLGDKGIEILIVDHRSPELEEVRYDLQFSLYEAIAQGNFIQMSEKILVLVEPAKLDKYQVFVDENYLYIQLFKNTNYLYEVIPRVPEKQPNLVIQRINKLEDELKK